MPAPGEHKTVQARILAYVKEIGWGYITRAEAEYRRGFDPDGATPEDRARLASLYFDDLLHTQILKKTGQAGFCRTGEMRYTHRPGNQGENKGASDPR